MYRKNMKRSEHLAAAKQNCEDKHNVPFHISLQEPVIHLLTKS